MTETIEIKPGQIRGKTEDALRSVLERGGDILVQDVAIPRTFERQAGICWTASAFIGDNLVRIYGRDVASKSVRNGMTLTFVGEDKWYAEAKSYVPRPRAEKTPLGTIYEWPAEPATDRLGRCVEALSGFGCLTDAATERIRKHIAKMKERGHE